MVSGTPPNIGYSEAAAPESGSAVKETRRIAIDYNPVSGRKKLNTYEIIRELGRGEHGRVKLAYDVDKHLYVAIKLLNRKEKPRLGRPQGSSTEEKVHREIAILKKCSHPNIVKLLEVLDDQSSRKIYLVLEYCAKGEIKWQAPNGDPALTREQARSVARNVALGLDYLHSNGIIHRDIKPANLLVGDDDVVKISDFGVSYAVSGDSGNKSELELAKTVGTPAFFSPELCIPTEINGSGERKNPPIGSKVDVWAYGVTLYCFLYGYLPFEADNEYELFRVIANDETYIPDPKGDEDLALANDLLKKLLTRDPTKRPSIAEAKQHPWLLKGLTPSVKSEFLNDANAEAISVSNEEVDEAVKGVNIKSRIKQGLSRIADQIRPKSRSLSRAHEGSGNPSSSRGIFSDFKASSKKDKNQGFSPTLSPSPSPPSVALSDSFADIHKTRGLLNSSVNQSDDSILEVTSPGPFPGSSDEENPRSRSALHGSESSTWAKPGIGLMPMNLRDDYSLASSSKGPSLENLTLENRSSSLAGSRTASSAAPLNPLLPEIEIPRLDSDSFWDESSSSSEDDDSGELTLVVGRNRTRSVGRQTPGGVLGSNGTGSAPGPVPGPSSGPTSGPSSGSTSGPSSGPTSGPSSGPTSGSSLASGSAFGSASGPAPGAVPGAASAHNSAAPPLAVSKNSDSPTI